MNEINFEFLVVMCDCKDMLILSVGDFLFIKRKWRMDEVMEEGKFVKWFGIS